MTLRPFDAFVFDLDGTLVDTASELVAAYQRLCVEYGTGEQPYETVRKLISHGSGRLVTEATGIDQSDSRWEAYRQQYLDWYEEILGSSAVPYPGTVDMVAEIAKADLAWGIVTNKFRRFAEPLMKCLDYEPAPASLVTPCDVSKAKPHPEPILLCCRELGVSPERTVYVGDHLRDIEAGNAAGCTTVAVKYGYIEDHDDPTNWGADVCLDTPSDLSTWIRSHL